MSHFFSRRRILALSVLIAMPSGLYAKTASAGEEPAGPPKPVFLPLGEFTVNLHDKDAQFGFIVVGVTLEVVPESANALRDVMPRMKEALIRRLMAMADRGTLAPGETDPVVLKASLADALQKINPDGIRDVLITRLLYG
jgi:flagellar basal body-associated protein FliL